MTKLKVPEYEGTYCRVMSLRHVAATKSRAMHTRGRVAGTCNWDIQQGQNRSESCTQENGAGTCLREMLQEHVLTCELTLRDKLVSTNGTLSLGSTDFLAS